MSWRSSTPDPGHVYVFVETPDPRVLVKVGESNDPDGRVRGLQTGNGRRLFIDQIVECRSKAEAQEIERYAQKVLEAAGWQANADNEWFGCPVEAACAAVDEAIDAVGGGWFTREVALPLRWRFRRAVAGWWRACRRVVRLAERGFAVVGVAAGLWVVVPLLA